MVTLMFTIQKTVKKEIGNKKGNKYLKSKKMPYHIKRTGTVLNTSKVVYYKGEDRWTDTYDDRKVYSVKATADAEITNARVSSYMKGSQVITE